MDNEKIVSLSARRKKKAADPLPGGRRGAERARIVLPAFLHVDGEKRAVDLLNLSATGAMIECTGLAVGHDVVLKCKTLEVSGVVVWIGNGRCGLQFDASIPDQEVKRHWFEGICAADGVTPGLRAAAQAWMAQNRR